MYSSRGIGRHVYNDRKSGERPDRQEDRSPYQNSPDINYRPNDRDDRKPITSNPYSDRYRNSPDVDNNSNSYHSRDGSRDGFPSPGPPPTPGPPNDSSVAIPYTPKPPAANPYNSNPNSSYRPPPPPPANPYASNPNPYAKPPAQPAYPPPSTSFDAEYGDEDRPLTQKEIEEKLFQEKLKVLFTGVNSIEDLITLKEAYNSKASSLDQILQKSSLREGEIMRNKRRDRTDFKDPMLIENRKLQEDVKRKLEEVNKFKVEIDKRIRAFNKAIRESMAAKEEEAKAAIESGNKPSNYEAQLLQNSMITTTAEDDDVDEEEDEYEYENQTKEYFDPGSHWCRDCDKMVPKIGEYFDHLHTKEHWKLANNELQPWRKAKKPVDKESAVKTVKTRTPVKGAQFLIALKGFYCPLCKQYLADNTAAEEHMKGAKHNRIYSRFTCLNIDYEHKWNTDKGKALMRHQMQERKKVKEEEQKENEKKKLKEEQKLKEEKEAKKRKREEENKRKEREDREDRKEREDFKSKLNTNSNERFRLKNVTLDLNDRKDSKSSFKDKDRSRSRDKHKRRTRIYSSSSSDSSSSSPPRKKRKTYFGDPYKDPKLKQKSFVPLTRLNRKTAHRYHCKELVKVIEQAKNRKDKPNADIISNSNTEPKSEAIPNSPIKMDIDIQNDEKEENDSKDLKCVVDDILKGLDDNPEKGEKETNSDKEKTSEANGEQKSDCAKETQKKRSAEQERDDNSNENKVKDSDNSVNSGKESEVRDESFESEPNLEINLEIPKESGVEEKEPKIDSPEDRDNNGFEKFTEPPESP